MPAKTRADSRCTAVQMLRSAPQARFWGKSETAEVRNDHVAHDSTGRMAKIRLPIKLAGQIRRKHGCNGPISRRQTRDAANIVTMVLHATGSITQSRQRNIHDVIIGARNRASNRET
jgi:hypothetical protein